jgi:hypothetical protein
MYVTQNKKPPKTSNPDDDEELLILEEVTRSPVEVSIHRIVVPSRVFHGFKSVLLLSAYFQDSQMYHLLKKDRKVSLQSALIGRPRLASRIREAENLIRLRFNDVVLLPLMAEEKKIGMNGVLIDMAVPEPSAQRLINRMSYLNLTLRDLRVMKSATWLDDARLGRIQVSKEYRDFIELVKEVGGSFSLLGWCLRTASSLVRAIERQGKLSGTPLLVVNKKSYASTLAKKYEIGGGGVFEKIPPASHGMNKYRECNVIAYLSANNPTPDMCRLFNILLPLYQPDKDHAADSCIQAVTRLSVREKSATDKVYVILPDMGLAGLVQAKLEDSCSLNLSVIRRTNMVSLLNTRGAMGLREGQVKGGKSFAEKYRKVRSPERLALDKQLAICTTNIAREKRLNREAGAKFKELSAEQLKLKKQIAVVDARDNPNYPRK